jgi:hypothetical protein
MLAEIKNINDLTKIGNQLLKQHRIIFKILIYKEHH